MTEKEMEDLLWSYPGEVLGEPLKPFRRQSRSSVGVTDLVFEDKIGRLIVVEVKKGKLPRGAVNQVVDYFGALKVKFPARSVELMVVANSVPTERRVACEQYDIEWREISERRFRKIAEKVGYKFNSEKEAREVHVPSDRGPRAVVGVPQLGGVDVAEARERLGAEWTVRDLSAALGVAKSNAYRRLKTWLGNGATEKVSNGRRGRTGGLATYRFSLKS